MNPLSHGQDIPSLTERDLIPVKDLIDEVRVQEQAEHLKRAACTWLAAFFQFKRIRRRYGLPKGKGPTFVYGVVIGDLKTTGKAILACVEQGVFSLEEIDVSRANFEACVRELACDDVILDRGLLSDDLSDIEAALGHA